VAGGLPLNKVMLHALTDAQGQPVLKRWRGSGGVRATRVSPPKDLATRSSQTPRLIGDIAPRHRRDLQAPVSGYAPQALAGLKPRPGRRSHPGIQMLELRSLSRPDGTLGRAKLQALTDFVRFSGRDRLTTTTPTTSSWQFFRRTVIQHVLSD
jgi:hypothetical protein